MILLLRHLHNHKKEMDTIVTTEELEKQFSELRHIVLNDILKLKKNIRDLEKVCIDAENAVTKLGSGIKGEDLK